MFIVTPSKWHSKRFRSEKPERVPSVSQIATVSPAAGLQRVQQTGQRQTTLTNLGRPEKAICFVDSCVTLTCGLLRVEGWTLDVQGDYVDLYVNGDQMGRCRTIHARKDVPLAIPNAQGLMCGFVFQYPFSRIGCGVHSGEKSSISISMFIRSRAASVSTARTGLEAAGPPGLHVITERYRFRGTGKV
jgi:hypothetical protein